MLRAKDFVLSPNKMESEYQLVEVSRWNEYGTDKHLGFNYVVLFPKLQFEKVKIEVKGTTQLVTNEELEKCGQIPVKFANLTVSANLYQGRLSAKGQADSVKRLDDN